MVGKPRGGVRHMMAMMIEGSLELISTADIPGIVLAPRTHALRAPHAKIRTQMENFRHEYEAKVAEREGKTVEEKTMEEVRKKNGELLERVNKMERTIRTMVASTPKVS